MGADAARAASDDTTKAANFAGHAGVGAKPATERPKLYARDERRGSSDVAGFEPFACGRGVGTSKRMSDGDLRDLANPHKRNFLERAVAFRKQNFPIKN